MTPRNRLFRRAWLVSARFKPEMSKKQTETGELHRKRPRQIEKRQGRTWTAPSMARRVTIPVTLPMNDSATRSLPRSTAFSPL